MAKTTKKKKKEKNFSDSGGFGKTSSNTSKDKAASAAADNDDFAALPALEKRVTDTIIPSPLELQQSGPLPAEIYDRLDQIYGFENFNYPSVRYNKDQSESGSIMSLDELISIPTENEIGNDKSKTSTTTMSNDDFENLLPLATGEKVKIPTTTSTAATTILFDSHDAMVESVHSLPQFSEFRVLHVDPLVLAIDDFFTNDECDRYVSMVQSPNISTNNNKGKSNSSPYLTRSKTVGKDSYAKAQRTSTTWFNHYKSVPELMAKASRLLGIDGIEQWEEPQIVRYRKGEKFTWHLDALDPERSKQELGGQRLATLLVYMTELGEADGGATIFRDLMGSNNSGMLKVRPQKGSALLFFPAAGGIPNAPFDIRTLHCGEAVDISSSQDKWISQLWLRASKYTPSAPPGNLHKSASSAITDFCKGYSQ